ncbi:GGDEF domain-containing protein [Rheinheimera baltica]|uniref:sensor domain-containing diguanylate cyclase n=1 Tax=Rheinheimera baltica TaxID=67576 RepID=UPI00274010EA|nr:GGDEF domain-containing protein [Rheinheimera baltica]MDP5144422.1 GGDEF domain-containing protein [Rheinheimera baltica]
MQLDWLVQPLLTQLNTGVLVLDAAHNIVYFNQFIARRADIQLSDVSGRLVYDIFADAPKAWLQRKIDGVLALQSPAFSSWEQRQYIIKLPHLRPVSSGSQHMAQNCSMLPFKAPNSAEQFVCLLIEDATDAYVYQQQLQHSMAQLELANRTDGLTGVFNRRHWQHELGQEIQRAKRYQHPLSLLLFDLDKFKRLNDQYGHQGGDAVLIELSGIIAALLRDTDVLGRYGGEEFGVILPETDMAGALLVANRICAAAAGHQMLFNGHYINATVSIGVSSFSGQTIDELIQQSDIALYNAKRQGRNQAVAWQQQPETYLKKVK